MLKKLSCRFSSASETEIYLGENSWFTLEPHEVSVRPGFHVEDSPIKKYRSSIGSNQLGLQVCRVEPETTNSASKVLLPVGDRALSLNEIGYLVLQLVECPVFLRFLLRLTPLPDSPNE